MGKFANFFKKIGKGIKKGVTKVWNFGKKVVEKAGKIARPVADVVSKVGGAMSALPGKAGAIGTGLAAGGSAVKAITDLLPDSQAKTKINESINKVVDTGQNAINKGVGYMNNFNDKAQPWIKSSEQIIRKIGDTANNINDRMPARFPFHKIAIPLTGPGNIKNVFN